MKRGMEPFLVLNRTISSKSVLRERERERENIVCQLYNTGNLGMPDIYATQPAVDWLRKPSSTL